MQQYSTNKMTVISIISSVDTDVYTLSQGYCIVVYCMYSWAYKSWQKVCARGCAIIEDRIFTLNIHSNKGAK